MIQCSDCTSKQVKAKGRCNSCYHKFHYQKNLEDERSKRRISGKKYYSTPKGRYVFSKNRSTKHRNIEWNLTFEQYENLIIENCYYCDDPLNPMGTGLDRLKNDLGYTIDNVVPCCGSCNKIKSDELTSEEMKFVMKKLKEYRNENS